MTDFNDKITLTFKALRNKITFWRIATLLSVFVFVLFFLFPLFLNKKVEDKKEYFYKETTSFLEPKKIVIFNIDKEMYYYRQAMNLIHDLERDDNVVGVVVRILSYGGASVAGDQIYLALSRLKKVKPVISVIEGIAASAGYMVALGTDRIIASRGSFVGSIGAYTEVMNYKELANNLGIKRDLYSSGKYKGQPSQYQKADPEVRKSLVLEATDLRDLFIDMVLENRPKFKNFEDVFKIADGRVFIGKKALDLGLIDGFGNLWDGIDWVKKESGIGKDGELYYGDVHDYSTRPHISDLGVFSSVIQGAVFWVAKGLVKTFVGNGRVQEMMLKRNPSLMR